VFNFHWYAEQTWRLYRAVLYFINCIIVQGYLRTSDLLFCFFLAGAAYVNMDQRKGRSSLWMFKYFGWRLMCGWRRIPTYSYLGHYIQVWSLWSCSRPGSFVLSERSAGRFGLFGEEYNTLVLLTAEATLFCRSTNSLVSRVLCLNYNWCKPD